MQHRKSFTIWSLFLILILTACTGATEVVFRNQTTCGTIRVELLNSQTNLTEYYDIPTGETITVPVTPNVPYTYRVDYSFSGTNADGFTCIGDYRGQVVVPSGASQRFNLTAATPTPAAP
jgi:hypothetical protein